MQIEMLILHPWHEVIGTVDSVETYEESVVINILTSRRVSLEISITKLKVYDVNLEQLVGQRISILRTDNDYVLNTSSPDNVIGSKAPNGYE
jgi:hypothetical protein